MKTKKIDFSLIILMAISLLTQVLSLLKSSIVAGNFGAGSDMDAYNLANNIVTFVFGFVASGISTIIIPEYANKRNKKSVDTFITLIYGVVIAVVSLMIILRVQLIGMFNNRGEMFTNLVANILVILLLSQFLSSIANITVAYFQCEGKYSIPKVVSLIFQIAVIIALMFFKNINIIQYTIIISTGVVFNFIVDTVIALKYGWRYKPSLTFSGETKLLFKRFLPIIVSTGVYRLTLMIDTTISSFLDTGKLSILSYSSQISSMVDAVIVGNMMIYLYPKITKKINDNGYQQQFWKSSAVLHAVVCLVSAGFLTVGQEGVSLLFQRGVFTADAAKMVFIGSAIYIVGQQTGIVRDLIYRYFYAVGDTKTPGVNSIIVSITNIIFSIILVWMIGFYGIIVGTFLSSLVSLIVIFIRFKCKIGFTETAWTIIKRYLISIFVFVVTVLLVYLTKYLMNISNNLISLLVFGTETVIIYTILSLLFNRKTLENFRNL